MITEIGTWKLRAELRQLLNVDNWCGGLGLK